MENTRMMRRKTREQRRKLMRKQKLYGLVFVLLSILICTAQHKPDGARHGETTGGEPGKRKKQAGACSFQRMQADCG